MQSAQHTSTNSHPLLAPTASGCTVPQVTACSPGHSSYCPKPPPSKQYLVRRSTFTPQAKPCELGKKLHSCPPPICPMTAMAKAHPHCSFLQGSQSLGSLRNLLKSYFKIYYKSQSPCVITGAQVPFIHGIFPPLSPSFTFKTPLH